MEPCDKNLADVSAFLNSPSTFDDGTEKVDVITTHGARVFLGKRDVYKIKLPVNYAYMDFSTLENRRIACKRELELNQPIAPSIYINTIPITRRTDGKLEIGGDGDIVEWAVYMHRFPESNVLEHLAENGALDNQLAANLGEQIAVYHKGLFPVRGKDGARRIEKVLAGLEKTFLNPVFNSQADHYDEFKSRVSITFKEQAIHLNSRARNGYVRRCHGDLHLHNIVLLDGVPTPFDALEFDEALATIDVLYDVAFLIMDLLHLGLKREANTVFNRYALYAWDLIKDNGFAVLPLFLSMRAAIRSMVSMQRTLVDTVSVEGTIVEAACYLDQSIKYLNNEEPKLIAVGGFSGTGKSTLAGALAPDIGNCCGALWLRSDLERKRIFAVPEYEHLPNDAYSQGVSDQVYECILEKARTALKQGKSVILDAVFANEYERRMASVIAEQNNVPFIGLWLVAPEAVLVDRVKRRYKDASDADEQVVKNQFARHAGFNKLTSSGWREVDASSTFLNTLKNAWLIIEA